MRELPALHLAGSRVPGRVCADPAETCDVERALGHRAQRALHSW